MTDLTGVKKKPDGTIVYESLDYNYFFIFKVKKLESKSYLISKKTYLFLKIFAFVWLIIGLEVFIYLESIPLSNYMLIIKVILSFLIFASFISYFRDKLIVRVSKEIPS